MVDLGMTDLGISDRVALPRTSARLRRPTSALALVAGTLIVSAFVGVVVGRTAIADTGGFEPALMLLLRFMALCKAAGVLGAAALLAWRLAYPLAPPALATYLAALGLMAAAPGLIWGLGLVAPGALLFHAGLATFLIVALRDDGVASVFADRRRRA